MATRFYIYAFFFDSGMDGEIEMEKVARGQCVWKFSEKLQFRCCTDCYCYTLLLVQDTLKINCMTKSLYI